ncbi:MAG: glycerophosphoryl diester phosphodiesterase membrane domain-containing protein [Lachnospiraceae bacterium]|nr:glycerophosphoryl diester phosphodiesterase membrane domain-containing protein [Lachnospiraceae bacterium]
MENNTVTESKSIPFKKLVWKALPEMWAFQFLAAIIMVIPAWILMVLLNIVAESGGTALTSANLGEMLLSWRAPVLLILGIILVLWFVAVEVFAQIYMNDDILQGNRTKVWREIGKGIKSIKRFFTPVGILVLLFILIAVPLCGIGFSISLTETFYIPNFIMEAVRATPIYALLYIAVILALAWVGWRYIFIVHGVILDGKTPSEAGKASKEIIKKNGKQFGFSLLKLILLVFLIQVASTLIFRTLPEIILEKAGETLPKGYFIDVEQMAQSELSGTDTSVIGYRILCTLAVLMGGYLNSVVTLLCGAYLILRITRYYFAYTRGEGELWPERPKKRGYVFKVIFMVVLTLLILAGSVLVGLCYNKIFDRTEPIRIIAHRAGGTMASENSIEGLYMAIEHQCYGSETDVQRTKDGYYIINHDNTFERLAGVNKHPEEMTLDEIRELKIKDTTGSGEELPVVTLEEMLDVIRGKEKLYIELKGATADNQMVDDVVRMVKEHDCMEDCVLISLNYDIIDYAETTYPEFETGTLFFISLGDVSRLNCDLLIMEESAATDTSIDQIHSAGKLAYVWTVNTEAGMHRFLASEIDGIITDEIPMSEQVQEELDSRTDLQVITDWMSDIWD